MIRVLTGATLIDGTGAAPVPDAAVVIDGDRVTAAAAHVAPITESRNLRAPRLATPRQTHRFRNFSQD